MVSSSKILTVSYGTFSCIAEGFEDPLAVMKETTHFFRNVVSEDRFFGAEPPQFDPEVAAEIMRERVEQSGETGKLSLNMPTAAAATASAGALTAALAAGPARAAPEPVVEAPGVPDETTLEASIRDITPAPEDDLAEDPLADADTDDAPEAEMPQDIALDEQIAYEDTAAMADPGDTDPPLDTLAEVDDLADTQFDLDTALSEGDAADDAPAPRPAAPALSTSLGVADKLARIRAVVAENADAAEPSETPEMAEDDSDEDAAFTEMLDALQPAMDAADEVEDVSDVADLTDVDADLDDEDADDSFEDTIAHLMTSSTAEAGPEVDDEDDEDEPEPTLMTGDEMDLDDMARLDGVPSAAEAELEDGYSITGDPVAASAIWSHDDEDEELENTAPAAVAPVRARVVKVKKAIFDKAVEDGRLEEVDEADPAVDPAPLADDSTLSPEEEDELARELAAVKAELAGDLDWDDDDEDEDLVDAHVDDAAEFESVSPDDDSDDDADDKLADIAASLVAAEAADDDAKEWQSPVEEDAPLRLEDPVKHTWDTDIDALAARASAELGEDQDDDLSDDMRDSARKAVKMASPARALLTEQSVEDGDTSRLMDQTQSEMDEPEGNRRRSAIAHLRAAVAATKADRLLGRKSRQEEELEVYREDLADVVRPRRPQSTSAETHRPEAPSYDRPAPLKLVAEQRVGDEDPEADAAPSAGAPSDLPRVTPVRPRRVRRVAKSGGPTPRETTPLQHAPLGADEPEGGFAAYADTVGATDLPELLEAAAAYMSYVQGRDQFSRPQLMTTVRQAEDTESSREDRLRSFGQLLREGKIEKTSGGRFTASERISFKPSRAAG